MNDLAKWLWMGICAHWVTVLWLGLALLVGYIAGLANPLYCARCRRHLKAQDIFRDRFTDQP